MQHTLAPNICDSRLTNGMPYAAYPSTRSPFPIPDAFLALIFTSVEAIIFPACKSQTAGSCPVTINLLNCSRLTAHPAQVYTELYSLTVSSTLGSGPQVCMAKLCAGACTCMHSKPVIWMIPCVNLSMPPSFSSICWRMFLYTFHRYCRKAAL